MAIYATFTARDFFLANFYLCMSVYLCLSVCQGHGFIYVFANLPLGPSFQRQQQLENGVKFASARSYPIKKFYNNIAHSNRRVGHFRDCAVCIYSGGGGGGTFVDSVIL